MVKLIAFDLDGTILNDSKTVSNKNIEALWDAYKAGITLVPTTGRIVSFLPTILTDLPFIRYAITSNGGAVYDLFANERIHSALIDTKKACEVQQVIDKFNVYGEYYINGKAHTISGSIDYKLKRFGIPEEKRYFLTKEYTYVDDMPEFLTHSENTLEKINLTYLAPEIKQKIHDELFALGGLFLSSSIVDNLEVNSTEGTKGKALEAICNLLNIKQSECMSIGDGGNDLEMIKWAGVSVAMGNATDEVKAHAKFTTTDYNVDGFAHAVNKYALK